MTESSDAYCSLPHLHDTTQRAQEVWCLAATGADVHHWTASACLFVVSKQLLVRTGSDHEKAAYQSIIQMVILALANGSWHEAAELYCS